MRNLVVLLALLVHGTAFAGGGGAGSFEIVESEPILTCEGRDTSVKIWREVRVYDAQDSAYMYVLEAGTKDQSITLESPDEGDISGVGQAKLVYLKADGNTTTTAGAFLESHLVPGKGGTLKVWEYDYDTDKKGELLISIKTSKCTKN